MARVLVPLAEGFEEIEFSTIVDVLRRAEVEVVVAGLEGDGPVVGSRSVRVLPDRAFDPRDEAFDLVVLPGGARAAELLAACAPLRQLLRERVKAGRPVAAICAAPQALDAAGVLVESEFTCYPGWETRLRTPGRRHETVLEAGAVITSQGPATAMEFALRLVERLCGPHRSAQVGRDLLYMA